jgi:hypothetical protein
LDRLRRDKRSLRNANVRVAGYKIVGCRDPRVVRAAARTITQSGSTSMGYDSDESSLSDGADLKEEEMDVELY